MLTKMILVYVQHRVGGVLSFFSRRQKLGPRTLGTPPTPHPQASVTPPPPPVLGGGAHSLAREGLGSPNAEEGTYNVVLFIHTYCTL
jgi:hypothetical protein